MIDVKLEEWDGDGYWNGGRWDKGKWKDLPKINIADIKKKLSLADYRVVATIIVVIAKKLTEHLCSYNSEI